SGRLAMTLSSHSAMPRVCAVALVAHAAIAGADALALVVIARVALIDRAPALARIHVAIFYQRVYLGVGAILSDILHAAERERPHHAQVLDVLAVDLGELGVALRAVVAVHHEPVLRLVLGVEQALPVDRQLVLRLWLRG